MVAKKTNKKKTSTKGKPEIVVAKGGLTGATLLAEVLDSMPEDQWLTKKQGKAFVEALHEVVTENVGEGYPVNLFGLVKITPRLHTAGQREVYKEFGNPDSGTYMKKSKAKTSFKTGQGIFSKALKDAMPSPQKLAKAMGRG